MRLVELAIARMPGIDAPYRLGPSELGAGVHLVHGPNGSGKSTLCRAVRLLLWPRDDDPRGVAVSARLEDGAGQWRVERDGAQVLWQRDGAPSEPPPLPDPRFASCFAVHADELAPAEGGEGDPELAARVLRAMSGGYDLEAVRERCFRRAPREGSNEAKAMAGARARLGVVQAEHAGLAGERERLAAKEAERVAARAAAAELQQLDDVARLHDARAALEVARADLAVYPEAMARLHGEEAKQLAELRRKLEAEREAAREAGRKAAAARAERAGLGLPEALDPDLLAEHGARAARARELERELAEAREDEGAARDALAGALRHFAPSAQVEGLLALQVPDLDALQERLKRIHAAEQRAAQARAQLEALGGEPHDAARLHTAREGASALRAWLRSEQPSARVPGRLAALGSLALAALLATVLALQLHLAWALALLAVVALLAALVRSDASGAEASAARAAFVRSALAQPPAWSAEAVGQRLAELEREVALGEAGAAREHQRGPLRALLAAAEAELRELHAALESLYDGAFVGTGGGALALADAASRLHGLRAAHAELEEARARAAQREAALACELERLAAFLVAHGEAAPADALAALAALARLERKSEALRRCDAELRHGADQAQAAQARAAELEREVEQLFVRACVEPGDERSLQDCLGRLEAWRDAREREREATLAARVSEQRLEGRDDLLALDPAALAARRARAQDAAERERRLADEVSRVKALAEALGRQRALEQADADARRAEEAFAEARERALTAEAGALLMERVAAEHARTSQPAVLERARASFGRFTHHAWELDVAPGPDGRGAAFRARDQRTGRGHALAELSSGTRAQLLLAARLAFAREVERGARLPLFLDDVLASSDPARGRAVAEALFALAQDEERQTLVLTPDPDDAGLFHEAAQGAPLHVVDLAALRKLQRMPAESESFAPTPEAPVPAPQGRSPQEYARLLQVPRLDPRRPAGDLHLYYALAHDLPLLHRLLAHRVERLGPLRALARQGPQAARLEAGEVEHVEAWARVAESVLASWRVGRGEPLTREVLEAAGITRTFLDRVCEVAAELGWDAARVADALQARGDPRLKGFRSQAAEALRAHLEDHGFLDPAPTLEREQAWARVLADTAGAELDPAALRARFEWLWDLCEGAAE